MMTYYLFVGITGLLSTMQLACMGLSRTPPTGPSRNNPIARELAMNTLQLPLQAINYACDTTEIKASRQNRSNSTSQELTQRTKRYNSPVPHNTRINYPVEMNDSVCSGMQAATRAQYFTTKKYSAVLSGYTIINIQAHKSDSPEPVEQTTTTTHTN